MTAFALFLKKPVSASLRNGARYFFGWIRSIRSFSLVDASGADSLHYSQVERAAAHTYRFGRRFLASVHSGGKGTAPLAEFVLHPTIRPATGRDKHTVKCASKWETLRFVALRRMESL